MKKVGKILALVLAVAILMSVVIVSATAANTPAKAINHTVKSAVTSGVNVGKALPAGHACEHEDEDDDGSWAIYWYICGSNLESNWGCATTNIGQLTWVDLPENVTFVIETGGASEWKDRSMSADKIQRWLYNKDGFNLIDEQPLTSMGDEATLESFLRFASDNYPADKEGVIFWNHGGGTIGGCCCDENFYDDQGQMDYLTMDEITDALSAVFTPNVDDPALEMIGFDACLMSTIDVAYTLCDYAHYMVASEETEPGNGWQYSYWGQALAANPGMKGAKLGSIICDSYLEGCTDEGTEGQATLAVTDLNRIGALVEAYRSFGREAMLRAATDTDFAVSFERTARACENYGGNNDMEGYCNLVDLGALAEENIAYIDCAQTIVDEIKNCVIYKISGDARQGGHGLSCYFSFNGNEDEMESYREMMSLNSLDADLTSFYEYMNNGTLDSNAESMLSEANIDLDSMPVYMHIKDTGWDGIRPQVDENANSSINLGPKAKQILASVDYNLYMYWQEYDLIVWLGSDDTMTCDWENGVFTDNFQACWGQIDGHTVYMILTEVGPDYELYAVPVMLNGEYRVLQVMYSNDDGWQILGARDPMDKNGMPSKSTTPLKAGDEITTIWYAASISHDDAFSQVEMDTFTVTDDTAFTFSDLEEGTYYMKYEMEDLYGDSVFSAPVFFDYEDGTIYVAA